MYELLSGAAVLSGVKIILKVAADHSTQHPSALLKITRRRGAKEN
jgi:hypothetical protein